MAADHPYRPDPAAHVPGPPRFSAATDLEGHDAGEIVSRAAYGLARVFVDRPREKYGLGASLALMATGRGW